MHQAGKALPLLRSMRSRGFCHQRPEGGRRRNRLPGGNHISAFRVLPLGLAPGGRVACFTIFDGCSQSVHGSPYRPDHIRNGKLVKIAVNSKATIQATLAELHEPFAFDGGDVKRRQGPTHSVLDVLAKLKGHVGAISWLRTSAGSFWKTDKIAHV